MEQSGNDPHVFEALGTSKHFGGVSALAANSTQLVASLKDHVLDYCDRVMVLRLASHLPTPSSAA